MNDQPILKLLARFALLALLLGTLILVPLYFLPNPPVKHSSLLNAIKLKHELLDQATSPKIILIGGSNVLMGVDSKLLSETFNYPVVNMSLFAGLGMRFMLTDLEASIKKGDIIVLMPEYSIFYDESPQNFWGRESLSVLLFDVYPEGKKSISPYQWIFLARFFTSHAFKKTKYYLKYYVKRILNKNTAIKVSNVNELFNEYGDFQLKYDKEVDSIPLYEYENRHVYEPSISFLKEFSHEMKKQEVEMYIGFPSFMHTAFYREESNIQKVAKAFETLETPILSSPERYALADQYFYDFHYHLNKEGKEIRTKLLIDDLKRILKVK